MSANSNNHEGQVVAVDHSSTIQVETLGTIHATEELQKQIKSGDRSQETADTQQLTPAKTWMTTSTAGGTTDTSNSCR